jgi:vitellogenic carboxypeptidase-like protein
MLLEKSYFYNPYNFLYEEEPLVGGDLYSFVERPEVRLAIHVGDQEFSDGSTVYQFMVDDFMNSVRPWLEELIENYRVLYYTGQMDIIVAYPLSVGMYNKLKFKAAEEYRNAQRVPWYVDGRLAGYMKSGGNFTEVLVRNAGHMVPTDQPVWALDLITRFTSDNLLLERK